MKTHILSAVRLLLLNLFQDFLRVIARFLRVHYRLYGDPITVFHTIYVFSPSLCQ